MVKKQQENKKNLFKGFLTLIFFVMVAVSISGCGGNSGTSDKEGTKKNIAGEDVKYHDERLEALVRVQIYPIKIWLQQGTKYQVAKGTSLADVFKSYKEKGLTNKNARWAVVKDGDRFVVFYRSEFSNEGLNNPQWAVQGDKVSALNGTAIKYTPELGYEVSLSAENKSKELQLYLKWEELMKNDDWDDSRNQANLDKVAKEFGVSSKEADKMFLQGGIERNEAVKEVNDKRGEILSDEKIVQLMKEQGDLYIPD